jgi:ABC-2 type transport system ATP-binding protein
MNDAAKNDAAIAVSQLGKVYREGWLRRRSFVALQGVSFQVARGEIFGLLGPNGAGKTTFIKILLGIVRKSEGQARLLGMAAGDRRARRRVGYLPENLHVPRHHTALSALDLYGQLSGMSRSEIRQRSKPLLHTVGLEGRESDLVRKYSKGMLQRLGLAQALLHDPDLIFLDEPTDGLDPVGRTEVRRILHELKRQGKTIFLNSHLLQEVELVCDRVAILDAGILRGLGSVDQLAPQGLEGVELHMEVVGDLPSIKSIHAEYPDAGVQTNDGTRYSVQLRLPSQEAIDQCIDRMRAARISIVSITPRRYTLEDVFLHVLAQPGTEK